MTTREFRSWVIRMDMPTPPGARTWLADVIEYHWRRVVLLTNVPTGTCARCGKPSDTATHKRSHRIRRTYVRCFEKALLAPSWCWLRRGAA